MEMLDTIGSVLGNILNSNWTISLVTGIASSIIVGFFSNSLLKRYEAVRCEQQIEEGKREIEATLGIYTAFYVVPDRIVVGSIINGVALRRDVSPGSLFNLCGAYQILLIKMLQSVHFPTPTKLTYIEAVEKEIELFCSNEMAERAEYSESLNECLRQAEARRDRSEFFRYVLSIFIALVFALIVLCVSYIVLTRTTPVGSHIPNTGSQASNFNNGFLTLIAAFSILYAGFIVVSFAIRRKRAGKVS